MMLLPCPWCGPRDAGEFGYAGEVTEPLDARPASSAQWREHLYLQANPAGWTTERWFHRTGCRRWLTVERDTVTGEIRLAQDSGTGRSTP